MGMIGKLSFEIGDKCDWCKEENTYFVYFEAEDDVEEDVEEFQICGDCWKKETGESMFKYFFKDLVKDNE